MKMPRFIRRAVGAVFVPFAALTVVMSFASPAVAHEERKVGSHIFVVGFGIEPAFAGTVNSLELFVNEAKGGDPVVEKVELQVEISFGDQTVTYEMEPSFIVGVFGEPGHYEAHFLPTRAGTYSVHFTGNIHGEEVDEVFTSGPDTYGPMEDPASVAFPVQDPSNAELNDLLTREVTRLSDDVDSANLIAYIAIAVGAIALLGGLLMRRPRKAGSMGPGA